MLEVEEEEAFAARRSDDFGEADALVGWELLGYVTVGEGASEPLEGSTRTVC